MKPEIRNNFYVNRFINIFYKKKKYLVMTERKFNFCLHRYKASSGHNKL